jgi:hypothetical protein
MNYKVILMVGLALLSVLTYTVLNDGAYEVKREVVSGTITDKYGEYRATAYGEGFNNFFVIEYNGTEYVKKVDESVYLAFEVNDTYNFTIIEYVKQEQYK